MVTDLLFNPVGVRLALQAQVVVIFALSFPEFVAVHSTDVHASTTCSTTDTLFQDTPFMLQRGVSNQSMMVLYATLITATCSETYIRTSAPSKIK